MTDRQPLFVIAGPTASGKTALGVALCRRFNGEIVSADSMQVYRELSVGTARPTVEEQQGIPHHLMGCIPLSASYSVAKYAQQAHAVIAEIHARGKLPILCGGTGLYIQAVTENLQYTDQPENRERRDQLRRRAETEGTEAMLRELAAVDPQTAARLHKHDVGRIVRALELYETTGKTITEQNEQSRAIPSPYRVGGILLSYRDRERLYDRINRRVSVMLKNGLQREVEQLRASGDIDTVRQAIGYKEWEPYFEGCATVEQVAEAIRQGTRRYAKRQLSWFRHKEFLTPLYADEYETEQLWIEQAACRVTEFLENG